MYRFSSSNEYFKIFFPNIQYTCTDFGHSPETSGLVWGHALSSLEFKRFSYFKLPTPFGPQYLSNGYSLNNLESTEH